MKAQEWLNRIFALGHKQPLDVWLRGSAFQLKVWQALVSIPSGRHASYSDMASYISNPAASRAVGAAIGANPIAWIIPCHRVIRKTGELGGYRWGKTLKKAMIAYEAGRSTMAEEVNVSR
jgi:AraC family transcriptional regulator of adaptative response/methylated-DNA-[protein]-cysteine methyltransferase